MKKKKRGMLAKEPEIERGFTVVGPTGKRVYLSSHPEGISKTEAERLSAGLATESQVIAVADL